MARKKQKQKPRQLIGPIFLSLACLFTWAAMLTFDVADWPNPGFFPHNQPVENACGRSGAWIAYSLFYWLGDGAYPLLLFISFAAGLWLVHGKIVNLLQRAFGLAVLICCTSATVALLSGGSGDSLIVGDGGVLGFGLSRILKQTFAGVGTFMVLAYSLVVGLVFVAEGWVLRVPGVAKKLRDASGEALVAARTAVATAIPAPRPATASAAASTASSASAAPAKTLEKDEEPVTEVKINSNRSRPKADSENEDPGEQGRLFEDDEENASKGKKSKKGKGKSAAANDATAGAPEADAADVQHGSGAAGAAGDDAETDPEQAEKPTEIKVRAPAPPPPQAPPVAYPTPVESWEFPDLEMLHEPEYGFNEQQEEIVRSKARLLEQTLEEFRLDARVVEIDTGPVITMFELRLGTGIKVSQVATLSNDIARALKAPAVRVVAPIPGKNTIGIEVPNVEKEKVRLKELMQTAGDKLTKMALPVLLGKDASGAGLLADLAAMPHMLIAGTTGSGKSVCINSIIASFLMTRKPDEVKLILVDPKMVEMSQFKDVPHLMAPIITDMQRAEQILDWAVTKMDERYELLAEARVRNISRYNKLTKEEIYDRFKPSTPQEKAQIPVKLPYIVIVIDELADLMMTSAKEVEHHLARLAQKSRAVGIHIVVATQRPEAKVVTGLIKSNLPCRVAFRVASRMDSRIVLDQNGAEILMGQGDMLFLPPGSAKLMRAQGTLLEDDELFRIIDFLAQQAKPEFHPQLVRLKPKGLDGDSERDPLFAQAIRIVLETQRGSVSLLQRRLTIGYSRASRLIDQMAEVGVVGEFKGSQAREVTMTLDEWDAVNAAAARDAADGYAADNEEDESTTAVAQLTPPTPSGAKYDDDDDYEPFYGDDDDDDEEVDDADEEEEEEEEEEEDDDEEEELEDEEEEVVDNEEEEEYEDEDEEYEEFDDDEEYEDDEEELEDDDEEEEEDEDEDEDFDDEED